VKVLERLPNITTNFRSDFGENLDTDLGSFGTFSAREQNRTIWMLFPLRVELRMRVGHVATVGYFRSGRVPTRRIYIISSAVMRDISTYFDKSVAVCCVSGTLIYLPGCVLDDPVPDEQRQMPA